MVLVSFHNLKGQVIRKLSHNVSLLNIVSHLYNNPSFHCFPGVERGIVRGYSPTNNLEKSSVCTGKVTQRPSQWPRDIIIQRGGKIPVSDCSCWHQKRPFKMGLGTNMEGCGKFVKWALFFVNFFIFVSSFISIRFVPYRLFLMILTFRLTLAVFC